MIIEYLILGDSYISLSYLFRISKSTISGIVYEVSRAIAIGLKDYLKVSHVKFRKVPLKYLLTFELYNASIKI